MKRNATGLLGGAVVLSMLTSPPHSPTALRGAAAAVSAASTKNDAAKDHVAKDWKPEVFDKHGRQDAADNLARVFLDVCREDHQNVEGSKETKQETTNTTEGLKEDAASAPSEGVFKYEEAFPDDPGAKARLDKIRELCRPSQNDFIIALVPDPVHTRLALSFDRAVEVIQEAAHDTDYGFVKAFLPWDSKAHPESADPAARLEAESYADATAEFPGVLSFQDRKPGSTNGQRHLFVLLVAESPTRGIVKNQFLHAVHWIQATASTSPRSSILPDHLLNLRILGPNFSGSLDSLAQLLHCSGSACYGESHIFSGSISNRTAVLGFLSRERDLSATLVSFQEADDVMIRRFREHLAGLGHGSQSLAILSEDETVYGDAGTGLAPQSDSKDDEEHGSVGPKVSSFGCSAAKDAHDLEAGKGCLYLYFPREISRLRAAYQSSGVGSSATETQSAPRDVLPLNLEISGADDDTIPAFSKQTPLSQEGVLLGIVSQLRLNAIKFIILRATDPLDLLFLSRYLAAAYPKARVVTIGADMLFRRAVEDQQLNGTLALSTYSLAPFANRGFRDSLDHPERIFPSGIEAGSYNALRSLLATVAEEGPPRDPCRSRYYVGAEGLHLYQYGWLEGWREKGQADTPPVHLLALGRDEYWPIAHLGPIDDPSPGPGDRACGQTSNCGDRTYTLLPRVPPTQLHMPADPLIYNAPISWVVAQLLVLLLALAYASALWFSSILSPSPTLAQFAATGRDTRQSLVVAAMGVFTAIFLILLFPFVAGSGLWKIDHGWGLATILYAALAALLAVTLVDTLDERRLARLPAAACMPPRPDQPILLAGLSFVCEWLERRRDHGAGAPPGEAGGDSDQSTRGTAGRSGARLSWFTLVVLLAIAAWSWLRWGVTDSPTGAWRHAMLRSMHLTSGVSPILPMLLMLAAGLWWMFQVSAGYVLLDPRRRPRLPMGVHRKRVGFVAETVAQDQHLCKDEVDERQHAAVEDTYIVNELLSALRPERVLAAVAYRVSFLACLAIPLASGVGEPLMTLEHPLCGWMLWYLFLLPALALISGTTCRLWNIWLRTRRLLTMLDSLPLRRGFEELKDFSWSPLWRLSTASPFDEAQRAGALVREAQECAQRTVLEAFDKGLNTEQDSRREKVIIAFETIRGLRHPFSSDWCTRRALELRLIDQYRSIQKGTARAAGCALDYLVQQWEQEAEEPRRRRRREEHDELGTRVCERFVCLLYVSFLQVVLGRMRTLMMAIGGMYILVLLAMTSYPFQPRATIVSVLAILLFFIISVVTVVFAQVHRNATLSRITNTNPGELGSDFWMRTGSFVALPLFSFLASQFPQLNRFLYAWVEPALRALNK